MKLLSSKVAAGLYKSTICPCSKLCCCVWAGICSSYLDMLDKLQKWVCRIVGPTFAVSLECLALHSNIASIRLFCRYDFGRCSSELAELVSVGRSFFILMNFLIFLSPFLVLIRMSVSCYFLAVSNQLTFMHLTFVLFFSCNANYNLKMGPWWFYIKYSDVSMVLVL